MSLDIWLVVATVHILMLVQSTCPAPVNVSISVSPAAWTLPRGETVTVECRVSGTITETLCKLSLSKSSTTEKVHVAEMHGKRIAVLTPGHEAHLLSDFDAPHDVVGNVSAGTLTLTFHKLSCGDDGYYMCELTYVAGAASGVSSPDACKENGGAGRGNFSTTVSDTKHISVDGDMAPVTMKPYFSKNNGSVTMHLNCSVETTQDIENWVWELKDIDRGWSPLRNDGNEMRSGVLYDTLSRCPVSYSILSRVLSSTEVGDQYRCYLTSHKINVYIFAAKFTVPVSAVEGLSGAAEEQEVLNAPPAAAARGTSKSSSTKNGAASHAVLGTLGVLAVVAVFVVAAVTYKRHRRGSVVELDGCKVGPRDSSSNVLAPSSDVHSHSPSRPPADPTSAATTATIASTATSTTSTTATSTTSVDEKDVKNDVECDDDDETASQGASDSAASTPVLTASEFSSIPTDDEVAPTPPRRASVIRSRNPSVHFMDDPDQLSDHHKNAVVDTFLTPTVLKPTLLTKGGSSDVSDPDQLSGHHKNAVVDTFLTPTVLNPTLLTRGGSSDVSGRSSSSETGED